MVINGGWGLLAFFEPFSKCSGRLFNIFLITFHPITFISVDDPTFLQHRNLVLGGHQEVLDGDASSEVNLYPLLVASSLYTFTQALVVRHNHIWFLTVLLGVCTVILLLLGRCSHFHLDSINCPCGVLASS